MKKPECIKDINILHKTQINDQLSVYIGQQIFHQGDDNFVRSQYMALVIHDEKNDQHVRLRLSSMRKIFQWVKKKHWDRAKKLSFIDKLFLCKTAKETYEDMVPDYKIKADQNRAKARKKLAEARRDKKLAEARSELHQSMERLHKLSDEDFYSSIGESLKQKIKDSEKAINDLGEMVIRE